MHHVIQCIYHLTQKPKSVRIECNYGDNYYGDQVCQRR